MNRDFVVLFIIMNVSIVAVGGFLAYSDLYTRKDISNYHENTTLIKVEYSPLAYRPTYQYWELDRNYQPLYAVVIIGSLTLDFFQLSVITVVISLLWFLSMRQKSD